MRNSNVKKAAVIALAGLMMAQTALTGCGKKEVDYNLEGSSNQDGEGKTGTSDRAGIGGKLGVPESCNETINVGNSTLGSITINCESIQTPDADKMDIAHFTPYSFSNEDKKKIAEALFDKEKGIYLDDYEHRTKSDIQEQIDWNKKEIENAQENGDSSWAASLEEEIKSLEAELAEAPDTYPDAGDYSGDSFFGTREDIEYSLSMFSYGADGEDEEEGMIGMGAYVYFGVKDDLSLRPYEGASGGYMTDYAEQGDIAGTNKSSVTAEEAEELAGNFLADMGVTDIVKTKTSDLYWMYYDEDGNTVANEADGYAISYARAVGGSPTYSGRTYNVDNLQQINGWIDIPVETYSVFVYDGKVVQASWQQIYSQADSVEENVDLLSYEQIIEKANTEMAKYYEQYPTRYKKVEFNDMRLAYYLVSDGEGKCKYLPVWIFSQYEEYTDSDGSDTPTQLLIMNAMDGTIIDIIEEAKALGCYQEY
ncbi:MAG: hypothetical protein J6L77_07515 [Coprococcus sp.]|nr:hypothetical protein [Coprococcus sp.]